MDDSLSHVSKPPPDNKPEDYIKEEIKSARNGLGLVLILGFSLGRTSQIFSRKPGTSGVIFQFAWVFGAAVQAAWFFSVTDQYGQTDAIPYGWILGIQGFFWLRDICKKQPRRIGFKHLGTGVFEEKLTRLSPAAAGVVSDILVSLFIAMIFHLLQCPMQSGWYLTITAWISFCHACVVLQGWIYRIRLGDARRRAKHWQNDVKGRHYL